ncbi:hypothetical protein AB4Z30_08395 [Paenibacillus sp. 2TAF8]|jgi:hypothetical protein|uniref:hypothetical protein n=1 Tax=Paenibacillus sp. 2TAF8 TaxID=3233020 RepID=UPI003F9A7C64
MRKLKLSFLLAISLVLSSLSGLASAESNKETEDNFPKLMQQADQLKDSGATDKEIDKFLKSQGVQVLSSNTITLDEKGNELSASSGEVSIMNIDAADRKVTTRVTKDSGRYYAWVQIDRMPTLPSNATFEDYPASYDVVSINWNPAYFNYVANGVTNANMWLADADFRDKGTILFNIYDNLDRGSTVSAYAKLSAKKAGSTTTAVKYTHTYDKTQKSSTYTGNASWSWGSPLGVGVSYAIATSEVEANWSKSATASVKVTLN